MTWLEMVGRWAAFVGVASRAALASLSHPQLLVRPLHQMLMGALPLAVVTGLALGLVIWLHTRGVLEKSGAGAVELLPTVLAVAVLLELAPVGAGLIVAARTGASLGAEFASMRVQEQIDAMQMLGVSPLRRLVGPRVLSAILAVPLLHVLISSLALGSGFLAESLVGSTNWSRYQTAVLQELHLNEVILAGLKTLVFGWLTAITGCYRGLQTLGGSEEVGRAATDSVVVCALLVLATDVLMVGVISFVK